MSNAGGLGSYMRAGVDSYDTIPHDAPIHCTLRQDFRGG